MHILYIDESGDLGALPAAPSPTGNDQPVLVVGGLAVEAASLEAITQDFLYLKSLFYPGLPYPSSNHLDKIIPEIKGADIRRNATRGGRNQRRHAVGFLDKLIAILQAHDVKLFSRVWVKALGQPFDGRAVYTSSIQWFYSSFDHFLTTQDSFGFCIADSRDYLKNVNVAHSVFTQKFRASSTVYSRVLELPTFGHSENHALIQICDIVCSALLYPIATEAYCTGHVANIHVQPGAVHLRQRFGPALKALQYRYREPLGRWNGGIVVADAIGQRSAAAMFQ
jgi:hypothetical protein